MRMIQELLAWLNRLVIGLLITMIGVVGTYVGIAFAGLTVFGAGAFDPTAFAIGSFALLVAPPATVAGIRLLFNAERPEGGLLSPRMLRVFAVFYAVLGVFSVWLVFEESAVVAFFSTALFVFVTYQAFALANRREAARDANKRDATKRPISPGVDVRLTAKHSPPMFFRQPDGADGQPPFAFVYVNEDGTVREVSDDERHHLSDVFDGADGGRPYIKSSFEAVDGWGLKSGFLARGHVPPGTRIESVSPAYDEQRIALIEAREQQELEVYKALGDRVEKEADGSVTITFNPRISNAVRLRKLRSLQVRQRKDEEKLAKSPDRGQQS